MREREVNEEPSEHEPSEDEPMQEMPRLEHPLADYQLTMDRQQRETRPSKKYGQVDFMVVALMVSQESDPREPANYKKAVIGQNREEWLKAMQEEMCSFMKNNTWTLVERPPNQKLKRCKLISNRKEPMAGSNQSQFKARIVAKGFSQRLLILEKCLHLLLNRHLSEPYFPWLPKGIWSLSKWTLK